MILVIMSKVKWVSFVDIFFETLLNYTKVQIEVSKTEEVTFQDCTMNGATQTALAHYLGNHSMFRNMKSVTLIGFDKTPNIQSAFSYQQRLKIINVIKPNFNFDLLRKGSNMLIS